MKLHSYIIGIFVLAFTCFQMKAQFTENDFLKANGTVLCNQSGTGDTISLRGTNLGSWLSMEYWIGPLGYGSINRDSWTITCSSNLSSTDLTNMLDGDESTYWNSGTNQNSTPEQWFMIDCGSEIAFNKFTIEAGTNSDQAIVQYSLQTSLDGSSWSEVASGLGSSEQVDIYTGASSCRYVKVYQTGSATTTWSVAEFNIFMNDDFSVRNTFNDRFGETEADALWDYYQDLWITTVDLDSIQSTGMNMVRVPFFWREVMKDDGTIKDGAFKQLDWVVDECSQRNIYVVLDLHGAPGGLDGYITSGQAVMNELWSSEKYQNYTIDLWKAIAEHYVGNPCVAAYDLLNEPVSDNNNNSNSTFYNVLYDAVRSVDPDHVICVQAFYSYDYITPPSTYGWENVLYQSHYYNTDITNWDSQDGFVNWGISDLMWHQQQWNVPVLAGEYNFWGHLDLWGKWMNALNSANISWSNWCYKNDTGNNNWGLYAGNVNEVPDPTYDSYEEIKEKWNLFSTDNFNYNEDLISTISTYTQSKVNLNIGSEIYLQAYDDTYISSESETMTCTKTTLGDNEIFTIVNAGEGKIALLGSNGKYVSSNSGTSSMTCNKAEIGETEKFIWVDLTNSEVALLSSTGYVCMESGSIPITANRSSFDGWEIFTWGINEDNAVGDYKENPLQIYPNPLESPYVLHYEIPGYDYCQIKIYNSLGHVVYSDLVDRKGTLNLSQLTPGLYIMSVDDINQKLIIR